MCRLRTGISVRLRKPPPLGIRGSREDRVVETRSFAWLPRPDRHVARTLVHGHWVGDAGSCLRSRASPTGSSGLVQQAIPVTYSKPPNGVGALAGVPEDTQPLRRSWSSVAASVRRRCPDGHPV